MLRTSGAIWKPETYHYRLPSGLHSGAFVRIADVFALPRAPAVLASWLYGCLTEQTAVVVDTGTLMPIVQQLDHVLQMAALRRPADATGAFLLDGLGGAEAMDSYPRSRFEYRRRYSRLAGMRVLALLSVDSTGRTYRLLQETLEETAGENWRAECLVTRTGTAATALPPSTERRRQDPWYSVGEPVPPADDPSRCVHCRNERTARLVHVDPRAFVAMALPEPRRIMPDIAAAQRNASLMQAYQAVDRLGTASTAVPLVACEQPPSRPKEHSHVDTARLVLYEPMVLVARNESPKELIQQRLGELQQFGEQAAAKNRVHQEIQTALEAVRTGAPTVAVCDEIELGVLASMLEEDAAYADTRPNAQDFDEQAKSRMLLLAQAIWPTVTVLAPLSSAAPDKLSDQAAVSPLRGHQQVALVVGGLRSGVTLHRLIVAVQDHFRKRADEPQMFGVVVHAHPRDYSAWHSVRNSFRTRSRATRLLALWLTYAARESPHSEEFDALGRIGSEQLGDLSGDATQLLERRIEWLSPSSSAEIERLSSPLWSPKPVTLRRTSLYGELDDRHTIAAVGAAMAEELLRHTSDGAPEWTQFDLPNAMRSYFDGLLHAAIVRWVTPERAWWGSDDNECVALFGELKGRSDEDWQFLLPELLLAAAQGKVPDDGVRFLLAEAKAVMDSRCYEADVLAHVELACALARYHWPLRGSNADAPTIDAS